MHHTSTSRYTVPAATHTSTPSAFVGVLLDLVVGVLVFGVVVGVLLGVVVGVLAFSVVVGVLAFGVGVARVGAAVGVPVGAVVCEDVNWHTDMSSCLFSPVSGVCTVLLWLLQGHTSISMLYNVHRVVLSIRRTMVT